MDHRLSSRLAAGAAIVLLIAGLAFGQAGRGIARMGGKVVDEAGNPIAGAKVKAVFDQTGGSTFQATTDKKGEWGIMGVGTGSWTISVQAEGYAPGSTNARISQLDKNPKILVTLQKRAANPGLIQDEATFKILEEGNALFKEGKYDTAIAMYEDFLAKNPSAYQVLLNVGDSYREKGEYDTAVQKYNLLIEKAAFDTAMGKVMSAKGLAAIGLCYLKQDKLPEAQDYFKRSIEMAPQDETLPYNVAEIYFSNLQIDDAVRYYDLAIQIKPDWPDPYYRLALAYLNKGENPKAIENLEKFIKLEPETERTAQAKSILEAIKK